ncbi:MAG: GspH/FimT family pseudopilin [Gemmatimonadota bacterium]
MTIPTADFTPSRPPACGRAGFTLLELVLAMVMVAVLTSVAVPRIGEAMRSTRTDRAVRTMVLDLEHALSMAARQRAPVRISQPSGTRQLEVRNAVDATLYLARDFGPGADFQVEFLTLEPAVVDVFPTGRTSSGLTVTLRTGDMTRVVAMSTAGQVRVVQ